jgi:hypothetical protein
VAGVTALPFDLGRVVVRRLPTRALTSSELWAIRTLLDEAFASPDDPIFPESDWLHALGGVHVIAELDRRIVAHAAVVPRELHVGGRPLRTGYVEDRRTQDEDGGVMILETPGTGPLDLAAPISCDWREGDVW